MLLQSLILTVVLKLTTTEAFDSGQESSTRPKKDNAISLNHLTTLSKMNSTTTFIEEGENMLRVPVFAEDNHKKKKLIKKSPKRIIQKIIKKAKSKAKKAYINQVTSLPTVPSEQSDMFENPIQDDMSQRQNDATSTQPTQKKKAKKWYNKRLRYPVPFQKLQSRMEGTSHKRNKRESNRSDVYILQDLDEIQFLGQENGNEIIEAHVKQYW